MKSLILAIESSCDDSSIAIIDKNTYECKFHKKISQEQEHSQYGGVVPELAARLHTQALPNILSQCEKYFNDLCAIAVTNEPGLSVSLIGGVAMAKILAISLNLPLIAINHLKGHIYSMFLGKKACFDMGVLLVSGGHTMVLFIDNQGQITEIARTNDDSFGESFDKVAKMMNLGYPGGAIIENLAKNAKESNLEFSIPLLHSKELAYSFSGLKNQVRLEILKEELTQERKNQIAFAFQKTAIAHIMNKLEKIFKEYKFKRFGIVGGASANLSLRSQIEHLCQSYQCELLLAPLEYCSDNALMIARAACEAYERKEFVSIEDDSYKPEGQKFTRCIMKKAFTIIELVFVVIILGVLAAVALPKFSTSKDEASTAQALGNLKTFINDINSYVLKNESLSSIALMSNVANIKNEDLSNLQNTTKELDFSVGNDEQCFKVLFVDKESVLLLALMVDSTQKSKAQNIADLKNQALKDPKNQSIKTQLDEVLNAFGQSEFTSTSKSKACQSLIHSKAFKDLATRVYFLSSG